MNIRWYLYWIQDFIHGSKVREAYRDLVKNDKHFDSEEQKEKIEHITSYAIKNCPYYNKCKNNIYDFPVVNKQIIKDNFNSIFVNKYDINKLHKMSTSGSTGTPFEVYQNKEKRTRVLAEVIFFGKKANYTFGEKHMYSRIWVKSIQKSKLRKLLQNIETFDISKLTDKNIDKMLDEIKSKKVKCLLSYASTLKQVSDYITKVDYDNKTKLKSIISGSELLNEDVRKTLSKKLNCKVYSRYSNEENGLLGQDTGDSSVFWLNETDYFFEFLALDKDETAKPGELSRIVVTDLYNFAMPMIRYDTGDLCIYSEKNGKKYIEKIYGRRGDLIYNTNGEALSPYVLTNNMWGIKGVKQWKFIQKSKKNYQLLLNTNKNNNDRELTQKLKDILGKDARIEIKYVDEIPVLNSGKRKYIENLTYK